MKVITCVGLYEVMVIDYDIVLRWAVCGIKWTHEIDHEYQES